MRKFSLHILRRLSHPSPDESIRSGRTRGSAGAGFQPFGSRGSRTWGSAVSLFERNRWGFGERVLEIESA